MNKNNDDGNEDVDIDDDSRSTGISIDRARNDSMSVSSSNDSNRGGGGGDLSGEAAGVVRGVSRSIVRAPFVGRLPRAAPKPIPSGSAAARGILRRRVPVRRVARVTDKVSTGVDWFLSAMEAKEGTENQNTKLRQWILRTRSFAWNLFRNTLLGMAVFETYGYTIGYMAPALTLTEIETVKLIAVENQLREERINPDYDAYDEEDDTSIVFGLPDAYSRASLPIHFFSGSIAGIVHGMVSSIMEGNSSTGSFARYTMLNTLHHSMAHSMLFGSYEMIKRGLLNYSEDEMQLGNRTYHLVTFALAGGMAGQIQHSISHYVESFLGLTNHTLQFEWRSSFRSPLAIRPLLWAFPPSAIGFVAFEYGKEFMT